MITVDFVQTMARYNAWQNGALAGALAAAPPDVLTAPRGAAFGSILGTLNHVLWADLVWMSRLAGWPAPRARLAESAALLPTFAAWRADRQRLDGRLIHWADTLRPIALRGAFTWRSDSMDAGSGMGTGTGTGLGTGTGAETTRPRALLVAHMFNHQTHHRGQVHAMMTAAGLPMLVSDLAVMPADAAA